VLYLLSLNEWVDHSDQVIAQTRALEKLLVDQETGMRGYLLTGDDNFLEPYVQAGFTLEPAPAAPGQLVSAHPPPQQRLSELRPLVARWQDYARRMMAARKTGGDFQTAVRHGEGKGLMDTIRSQLTTFVQVEEELRDDRSHRAQRVTGLVIGISLGL